MATLHNCVGCNNSFASSQSLWNHKQRCLRLKPREFSTKNCKMTDFYSNKSKMSQREDKKMGGVLAYLPRQKEITPTLTPPMKRSKREMESTNVDDLTSNIEELHDEILDLLEKLKVGNSSVKPRIITILKKLREKGVLNRKECADACAQIHHNDSGSEDTSKEEGSESETEQNETSTNSHSEMDEEKTSSQESESGSERSTDSDSGDEEFNQLIRNVAIH